METWVLFVFVAVQHACTVFFFNHSLGENESFSMMIGQLRYKFLYFYNHYKCYFPINPPSTSSDIETRLITATSLVSSAVGY